MKNNGVMIPQQDIDELIEKRELAKARHGVDSETFQKRKKEYKMLKRQMAKKQSRDIVKKIVKSKRSHDHL